MSRYVEQTRSFIADQKGDVDETAFFDKQTFLHNHEVYLVVITMLAMRVSAVKNDDDDDVCCAVDSAVD